MSFKGSKALSIKGSNMGNQGVETMKNSLDYLTEQRKTEPRRLPKRNSFPLKERKEKWPSRKGRGHLLGATPPSLSEGQLRQMKFPLGEF